MASTPITVRDGTSPAETPSVQSTATVFVKTDDMPKAIPEATASRMLRTAGCRCTVRAATVRAATATAVASAAATRWPVPRDCASDAPTRDSRPASPTVAMRAPRHAVAPALRPTNSAAIGSANTIVSAPSGWTRLSGP
ncbi:hypothetical protein SHIRM173S_12527 [Streptomyces hirsutus]